MPSEGGTTMRLQLPGDGLTVFRKEMNCLFDRMWEGEMPRQALGEWTPILDLSETKDSFLVKMEVPGIDPKEIKISLQDHVLTISGERKKKEEEKDERFYRIERSYGAFTRSMRLPMPVDEKRVNAVFKNGMLTITVSKTEAGKGTIIPIKSE
jgi:HSP20 family protein